MTATVRIPDDLEFNRDYWDHIIDAVTWAAAGYEEETVQALTRAKHHGPVGDYLWSRLLSNLGHLSKHDVEEYEDLLFHLRGVRDAAQSAAADADDAASIANRLINGLEKQ